MSNGPQAVPPLRIGDDRSAPTSDLQLVQGFVNTHDFDDDREDVPDPESLAAWLAAYELMSPGDAVSSADHETAIKVREALRALMFANNGVELDPAVVDVLNAAGKSAEMMVRFRPGGKADFHPVRAGVDGAFGRLFDIIALAQCDGTWTRMKACPDDDCGWVFYDGSKNRSATWCSMDSCGNRAKARAYRERRRAHSH